MSNPDSSNQPTLAVPGVIHVSKTDAPGGGVLTTGSAVGWISPSGIREWSHEVSLIARNDLTDALREELGVTLPEHRIAKSRHPHAYRAAESSALIAVLSDLAPRLVEKGVRVHTVGFDRVTGGFLYFAEGGAGEPVRVHGDLLEMIEPALAGGSSNADIDRYLDRFIDRVLQHFSKGLLNEPAVELANALPRLATDARGLSGVDLDAFEAEAAANVETGKGHEDAAKKLAEAVASANGTSTIPVPLFGEARAKAQPVMAVMIGGAAVMLPERTQWIVSGPIREEAKPAPTPKPAAVAPTPKPAPAVAPSPKPAAVTPIVAKPIVTPTPAPAVKQAPRPVEPRLSTPGPKIPAALAAKPMPASAASSTSKPVIEEPKPEPKPEPKAEPVVEAAAAVVVVRPVEVIGVGEAPLPPEPKREEPKPEPVVEAKPEPKPEPVVEAKPEPKPEPVVVEAKPEPKPEPVVEKKPVAETKPVKREEPETKLEKAAPPPPAKSNAMMYVIVAILIAAAAAFFLMKK